MEYMIVKPGNFDPPPETAVFINGERNGFLNEIIMIDSGVVQVSADVKDAESKIIILEDTIIDKPKEVIINVIS